MKGLALPQRREDLTVRLRIALPFLLALAALFGAAQSASAATLWTSTAHTVRVPIGTTTSLVSEGPVQLTNPTGVPAGTCGQWTLHGIVIRNDDTASAVQAVGGTTSDCTVPVTLTFTPPWTFTFTGTGTPGAGTTSFTGTLDNAQFDLTDGLYTNPAPVDFAATQPLPGTSPITLRFNDAGPFFGPTGAYFIDASFVFEGPATGWSLTN
jgi:hypothetical protein